MRACIADGLLGKAQLTGRRDGLPRVLRLPVPAETDGPDGRLCVTGGDHHAPNPRGAAKVERVNADAGVSGTGSEAEGLDKNGIEVGRGAGRVEALEEEAFVDGGVAAVLGGSERSGQNDRVRVGLADGNGRRAQ